MTKVNVDLYFLGNEYDINNYNNKFPLNNIPISYYPIDLINFKKKTDEQLKNELEKQKKKLNDENNNYNNYSILPITVIIVITWIFIFIFILKYLHYFYNIYYIYVIIGIITLMLIISSIWYLYVNNDLY